MRTHEPFGRSTAEFAAQSRELVDIYHADLSTAIDEHLSTSVRTAEEYYDGIERFLSAPQGEPDLFTVTNQAFLRIDSDIAGTSDSIITTIDGTGSLLAILPPTDRRAWENAHYAVGQYGLGNFYVDQAVNSASPDAQPLIRAGLDPKVLEAVLGAEGTKSDSPTTGSAKEALMLASSGIVQQAIKAGPLDQKLFRDLKVIAGHDSFPLHLIDRLIDDASTAEFQQVMKIARDRSILQRTQNAQRWGNSRRVIDVILSSTSQANVRDAIRLALLQPVPQSDARQGNGLPFVDFYTRFFGDEGSDYDEPTSQYAPPQEQEAVFNDDQIEEIIRRAVHGPEPGKGQSESEEQAAMRKGNGWLANEDRAAVRRVVNTVMTLRRQAAAKEQHISDRQIYVRYRLAVERSPREVDPDLLQSFKIFQALIGGNPKGKLPF
jgi:hypothetical protein